jgi:nitroreductase
MTTDLNISDFRQPEHAINPLILKRWSPRAFSGEALTEEELLALFEAAKWAPSNFNNQSWRFIYAKNNTPHWSKLFALLNAGNQSWVSKAAVLVLVISKQTYDYNGLPFQTGSFDTGAAWENLALEAASRDLVAHGLGGFDYDRARTEFNIPAEYRVEAMLALGRPGNKEDLPAKLQAGEFPSDRKKLSQIISEGEFKF